MNCEIKMIKLKVLHICEEDQATAHQRVLAFRAFECFEYTNCFHTRLNEKKNIFKKLLLSFFHKFHFQIDIRNINKEIVDMVSNKNFDIVFIEKCFFLKPSTLRFIKERNCETRLICYILDDFLGKGNKSILFNYCIPLYDIIATNKRHNLIEYYAKKAQRVYYFKNGYSFDFHRPIIDLDTHDDTYRSEVAFIGTYTKDRADILNFLASNGIEIKVWGWGRKIGKDGFRNSLLINMNKHVYLDEFAKVVSSTKINLNFLRKSNRDTETTRSVEIPACGGFMIAEKTKEHIELFSEDNEAVYFSSKEELLLKIKYYLANDDLRNKIANSGRKKCVDLKLDYGSQISRIIESSVNC